MGAKASEMKRYPFNLSGSVVGRCNTNTDRNFISLIPTRILPIFVRMAAMLQADFIPFSMHVHMNVQKWIWFKILAVAQSLFLSSTIHSRIVNILLLLIAISGRKGDVGLSDYSVFRNQSVESISRRALLSFGMYSRLPRSEFVIEWYSCCTTSPLALLIWFLFCICFTPLANGGCIIIISVCDAGLATHVIVLLSSSPRHPIITAIAMQRKCIFNSRLSFGSIRVIDSHEKRLVVHVHHDNASPFKMARRDTNSSSVWI